MSEVAPMEPPRPSTPTAENVGPFQFTLLVLSVLALAAIAAETFLTLPPEIARILRGLDLIACSAFFLDFLIRFRAAESKWAFMKWGWIDLVASIPNIAALRLGRFVRVLRILRLIRAIGSLHRLVTTLATNKTRGGIAFVVVAMFLLIVFASIAILLCETQPASNILTAGDAVWWSVTTVTTVGYGDCFPVTAAGRVVAMTLMLAGVGLFGGLSGVIASAFLGQQTKDAALADELAGIREELHRLREDRDPPPPRG